MFGHVKNHALTIAALCLPLSSLLAQPHRIVRGNLSPQAQPRFDRGPVDPDTRLGEMSLVLRRSPEQQAKLEQLLSDQQDPASPRYHQWVTPEQFAEQFSADPQRDGTWDILTGWLQSNGFTIIEPARGRDYIRFTGAAGQVEAAMRTQIHHYLVNGEMHYANAAEPSLPENLAGLVAGIRGLHDFHPKAPRRRPAAGSLRAAGVAPRPDYFSRAYPNLNILTPDDLATIYNVNALYSAGIDGSGQKIAVIGESDVDLSDIRLFRSAFGLPANDPVKVLVPGSKNPGFNDSELEADLDLEWSGAIARNATILYVFSGDPLTSAYHAIDQALAPVVTFSFGLCELGASSSDISIMAAQAQKAAALGITWVASSGDAGAAGCEDQNGSTASATTPLSVNLPASLPEVTGVGGTEFNEGGGSFFSSTPRDGHGTALSYIPEGSWTDEDFLAKNKQGGFAASGGGSSLLFGKPAWQKGLGVPGDGARDVPDVALTASGIHDPYALIASGQFIPSGGTSAAAPSFAGILALINQQLVSTGAQARPGLGNINPMLYSLAQTAPAVFHDITRGSNIVPCVTGSTADCTSGSMGYQAGSGYDLVTGLGSVDAFNLALDWNAKTPRTAHLVVTSFTADTAVRVGGSFSLSMTVTNQGAADAGAFDMRAYFTTNGSVDTAVSYVHCEAKGLTAGATANCAGSVTLSASVTPGTYQLLAVADGNHSVTQSDNSGGTMAASTGSLTVTK